MGNLGITYEQVREAADQIHKSGDLPTIEKVRIELGNTGSNSTLSRHLRQWKQERTQIPPLPDNDLSPSLKTTLETLVNQTRSEARAELLEDRDVLQQELEQACQHIERLTKDKNKLNLQLIDHQHQLQEARQVRALTENLQYGYHQNLEALKSQNNYLQQQLSEQKVENTSQAQQLETSQSDWEQKHRLEVQRHETAENQYFCHLDQLRTEQKQALKLLKSGAETQEQRCSTYKEEIERLTNALTSESERRQNLEQNNTDLKQEQRETEQKYNELLQKYQQVTDGFDGVCLLLWYNTLRLVD